MDGFCGGYSIRLGVRNLIALYKVYQRAYMQYSSWDNEGLLITMNGMALYLIK
jgi:hypothetical protein